MNRGQHAAGSGVGGGGGGYLLSSTRREKRLLVTRSNEGGGRVKMFSLRLAWCWVRPLE